MSRVPLWSEYEDWPRGRVIFNKNYNQFVVYADKKILTDIGKKEISLVFYFPDGQTVFKRDGHYVSYAILQSERSPYNTDYHILLNNISNILE